jgi:predicted nicotinamide N-methyase
MFDATVVATAAITGGVGLAAALIQARTSWRQMDAERDRHTADAVTQRRTDRQQAYLLALDLLTDFGWDAGLRRYNVVEAFNKPFLHAANRVRLYGSPAAIAAIASIQDGFAALNDADGDPTIASAQELISQGMDDFANAARDDVGPRPEDALKDAYFPPGLGPSATNA